MSKGGAGAVKEKRDGLTLYCKNRSVCSKVSFIAGSQALTRKARVADTVPSRRLRSGQGFQGFHRFFRSFNKELWHAKDGKGVKESLTISEPRPREDTVPPYTPSEPSRDIRHHETYDETF